MVLETLQRRPSEEEQKEKRGTGIVTLCTQALVLESERKHAARLALKVKLCNEFFTLQMVYWHQVCGETSV